MKSNFYGCRIHFKKTGSDGVMFFKTIEESNTFFGERKREFMNLPSSEARTIVKIETDIEGRYEDENVVLSKENLVLPF